MTKTMGQTVYDIFGPNIGHSAASQIAALGAYALTDEYMEELKREAESDAEMARLYIEDHKRTQEKEYLEYANQYSKDKSEKLRLIDELMNARLCLLTEHPLYVVYDKMTIFGVDFDHADRFVWVADEYDEPDNEVTLSGASYRRIGVRDERRFVTACLTMEAAKLFIEDNQHHLRKPFVYAESLSNNPEMIAVRKHLAECIRRES